jgi:hypothetical protein
MVINAVRPRRAIEMVRRVPIAVDVALAILQNAPDRLLATGLEAPWAATAGHGILGVDLPGGVQVTREVRMGLGPLLEDDGVYALPVWWEAAEHPHLFPTFDGGVEIRGLAIGTEVRLVGSYQPPLGILGRFADGVVGHRIVTASLEAFLAGAAERLTAAAADMIEGTRP